MSKALRPENAVIYGLPAPRLIIFVICCIIPLFMAVYNSFFDRNGGPEKTFIGLQNYAELIGDRALWSAFMNNLTFIFWTVFGQIGIAFITVMSLQSRTLRSKNLHRAVISLPVVLSAVVMGFLWRAMHDSEYGIVNTAMKGLGLERYIQLQLDNPGTVIGSLAVPKVWQLIEYYLTILLAATQGTDQSVPEMAEPDRAIGWKKSWYAMMPLIKSTLMVTVTLCISDNVKAFNQILVMTGGGSGTSSEVVAPYTHNVSMNQIRYGYDNTVAIGILILSSLLILISKIVGREKKGEA